MKGKADIKKLFEKFASLKVLIVGDVMLDNYIHGNVDRISPEAPVPVVLIEKKETRLGGAANVAMNIKSLGAVPLLVGVTGDDADGKLLSDLLQENTIENKFIIADRSRVTTSKTRVIAKHNQMLRLDNESHHDINSAVEEEILLLVQSLLENENPDILIFEDYNKGLLTEKLIREITMSCLNKNIPVAVDPKKINFFTYQLCTLFKPNVRELQESLQMHVDVLNPHSLSEATATLHKKIHHGISLLTLGDKGVYLKAGNDVITKPAHIRNVSDVSGAGDTVISVAALCLAAKTSLDTLAALSNMAGGIVCEYPGVVPIDKERLMEEAMEFL